MTRGRHRVRAYLLGFAATLLVIVMVFGVAIALRSGDEEQETRHRQAGLEPFYVAPPGWEQEAPGTVLKREAIAGVPSGGRGWRILYRTEAPDGSPALSSGLLFVPDGTASDARPVVAWAHPTVGMGDACAPSRTPDPGSGIPGLASFLEEGWVVTATDYAGLGTSGTEEYLVGEAEARDVLNSVRAARNTPEAEAGRDVLLWGHSQGGHAALFAGQEATNYAPELKIKAIATAAPATELPMLFAHQWKSVAGSLVGSEVLDSWPHTYPGLSSEQVARMSPAQIQHLADACIAQGIVELEVGNLFGADQVFKADPTQVPSWNRAAEMNTPAPPDPGMPTLVVQGLKDPVVLPRSTAAYVKGACDSGSDITTDWVGGLGHLQAGFAAAPEVFTWFQERLKGRPTSPSCGTEPPISPYP